MSNKVGLSYLPKEHGNFKIVDSLEGLIKAEFNDQVNCIIWPRNLEGDFTNLSDIIWHAFNPHEMPDIYRDKIRAFEPHHISEYIHALLNEAEKELDDKESIVSIREAFNIFCDDFEMLKTNDFFTISRALKSYPLREQDSGNVNEFHADRVGWDYGRVLICYTAPTTEYIHIEDNNGKPKTKIYQLHPGDVVRMAGRNHSKPFIHRGTNDNHPRLLTIAHLNSSQPKSFEMYPAVK